MGASRAPNNAARLRTQACKRSEHVTHRAIVLREYLDWHSVEYHVNVETMIEDSNLEENKQTAVKRHDDEITFLGVGRL